VKGRYVMKIEGCIALVTGSNRGLGTALVSALLEAGAAKVYAAARDPRKVVANDPRVVPLALDTSKPEQIAAAAEAAGDVTLLVNNAGVASSANVLTALPGPIDTEMVKDLQLPKASPAEVAKGVLAGVERGEEDIFPDPMARQMGALWSKSPKEFERAFAGL
jgi:NAD(P)-dependent dehydrogenase (short-subunit alcohol dehydrogenase family)